MKWETNQAFAQLPAVAVGDIIHLRQSNGFTYLVKAIVSRVSPNRIDAVVDAVFDGAGQGQITGGELLQLVGSTLSVTPQAVHKVIHRNVAA